MEGINFKFKHVFSPKLTFRTWNMIHETGGGYLHVPAFHLVPIVFMEYRAVYHSWL